MSQSKYLWKSVFLHGWQGLVWTGHFGEVHFSRSRSGGHNFNGIYYTTLHDIYILYIHDILCDLYIIYSGRILYYLGNMNLKDWWNISSCSVSGIPTTAKPQRGLYASIFWPHDASQHYGVLDRVLLEPLAEMWDLRGVLNGGHLMGTPLCREPLKRPVTAILVLLTLVTYPGYLQLCWKNNYQEEIINIRI